MEVSIKFSRTNEEFSLQFSPSASRFLLLTVVYPFCGTICLTFFRIFVDTLLDERQARINWEEEIRRWIRSLFDFIAYCLFGFASLGALNRLTKKVPEEMALKSTCWFVEGLSVLLKPITYLRQKSSNISFFGASVALHLLTRLSQLIIFERGDLLLSWKKELLGFIFTMVDSSLLEITWLQIMNEPLDGTTLHLLWWSIFVTCSFFASDRLHTRIFEAI